MTQVEIKKLHPDAQIPKYATKGAACFDLIAIKDSYFAKYDHACMVETGLSFEVPDGYVMLIYARSGIASTKGLRPANCVGVIDSDYRGQVIVPIVCDAHYGAEIEKGTRIAQAMIVKLPDIELVEADELSQTERGSRGFGSTGN